MIPYRAKNPPESFPYATIGLIAVNALIFIFTSQYLLVVKEGVVEDWALSHNNFSAVRMVSAMFLHANLSHLLSNMLALWLFGAAVEGRLGVPKYLLVYLLCGLAGDGLHELMVGIFHPDIPSLGASGAIMGLAGAYLYLFPFARICIFWGWNYWRFAAGLGWTSEWQAQWVVLYYVGFDLLNGFLTKAAGVSGGVGNFAHLGGAGAGFLLMLALRARRDTEEASDAQAMRSEFGGDYRALSLPDLEALVQREPDNLDLVTTFCQKALFGTSGATAPLARSLFLEKADQLVQRGDIDTVTKLALLLSTGPGEVPQSVLLRLAARQEREGDFGQADQLMRRALSFDDRGTDAEMVWARLARLTEQSMGDKNEATKLYTEQLLRFPNGAQSTYARTALQRLGGTPPPAGAAAPPLPTRVAPPEPKPASTLVAPPNQMPTLQAPRRKPESEPEPSRSTAPGSEGKSAEASGLRPIGG
jgi:membrane associated rhomboid family serine protease